MALNTPAMGKKSYGGISRQVQPTFMLARIVSDTLRKPIFRYWHSQVAEPVEATIFVSLSLWSFRQAQRPPKIDFPVKTTVFVDFFHGRFDASMLRQAQQPQVQRPLQ